MEESVAVVTGAGQGLGREIALALSENSINVIVADINKTSALKVAEEINESEGRAEGFELDISNVKNVEKFFEKIIQKYKKIDFLINNAGIDSTKPIEELTINEIENIISVNLKGTFIMCKFALERMYPKRKGHIVNISSTAAKRGWAKASAYHATKWGIMGLSQGLFVEAREHNVKVSAVIPGGMRTPFLLDRFPDIPKQNLQDPKDVAQAILFVLTQPENIIIPELMIIPLHETSWP